MILIIGVAFSVMPNVQPTEVAVGSSITEEADVEMCAVMSFDIEIDASPRWSVSFDHTPQLLLQVLLCCRLLVPPAHEWHNFPQLVGAALWTAETLTCAAYRLWLVGTTLTALVLFLLLLLSLNLLPLDRGWSTENLIQPFEHVLTP